MLDSSSLQWEACDCVAKADRGRERAEELAVIIPCYRPGRIVSEVIAGIGPEVKRIYLVDDGCPDTTGTRLAKEATDPRLVILHNERNLGVGGAMKRGYAAALADGADILIKIDADGQMDPALVPHLCAPILAGRADYAKGNRLAPAHLMPRGYSPLAARQMPFVRHIGNRILSVIHKGITGYWNIVDPSNGYTAIHRKALEAMDLESVPDCYLFEIDMLFQLNRVGAVVADVPMPAIYRGETSHLRIRSTAPRFAVLAFRRLFRRIVERYFLPGPSLEAFKLASGLSLVVAGLASAIYFAFGQVTGELHGLSELVTAALLPLLAGLWLFLDAMRHEAMQAPVSPISRAERR